MVVAVIIAIFMFEGVVSIFNGLRGIGRYWHDNYIPPWQNVAYGCTMLLFMTIIVVVELYRHLKKKNNKAEPSLGERLLKHK